LLHEARKLYCETSAGPDRAYCARLGEAHCLRRIAIIYKALGQLRRAERYLRRALKLYVTINHERKELECLRHLAQIAYRNKEYDRAVRLYGAEQCAREGTGISLIPEEDARHREWTKEMTCDPLVKPRFETAYQRGATMDLKDTVNYALASSIEGDADGRP